MQYISPVSLLDTADLVQLDKKSLALARKKMLAELELNGGQSITINGWELTKNDIIIFFDNFQQDANFVYHIAIVNDKVLLDFLERGVLENWKKFNKNAIYNDADFIEWLSPYFFTSFNNYARECLNNKRDNEWATLLANPLLMNTYYAGKAWQNIEAIIQTNMEALHEFEKSKGFTGRLLIEPLTNFRYISMLQRLPDEYFAELKDDYAFVTMQCAVYVYNRISRSIGTTMVENALALVVSGNVQASIADKLVEMQAINQRMDKKRSRKMSAWGVGFFVVYLFLIIRFVSCGGNSSYDGYNYQIPSFPTPKIDSIMLDSIRYKLQHLKLGNSLTTIDTLPADTAHGFVPVAK